MKQSVEMPPRDIDTIENVNELMIGYIATSTPTRLSCGSISPKSPKVSECGGGAASNKGFHSSNLSIVDKDFHDQGIKAVREMYDSANVNKKELPDHHHHHHPFDFIKPSKLSQKFNKDKSEAYDSIVTYQKENKLEDSYSNNDSPSNNNNSNSPSHDLYSKVTSVNSTKKFTSESKYESPVLPRQTSISSSNSFLSEQHDERNNRRKLNDLLMSKFKRIDVCTIKHQFIALNQLVKNI